MYMPLLYGSRVLFASVNSFTHPDQYLSGYQMQVLTTTPWNEYTGVRGGRRKEIAWWVTRASTPFIMQNYPSSSHMANMSTTFCPSRCHRTSTSTSATEEGRSAPLG